MTSEDTEPGGFRITIDGIDRTADAGTIRFATPNVVYDLNGDEPGAPALRAVGPCGFYIVFTSPNDSFADLIDRKPHGLTLRIDDHAMTVIVTFGGEWTTKDGARRIWATLDHTRHAVPAWSRAQVPAGAI